jgi:ABC-2 type transport system ATP-binding protein
MLSLTNLRKSFGSVVAVDGLSLEIKKGEVFGLLGPNGAGKSTTINMAIGLLRPDTGAVRVDGAPGHGDPTHPHARKHIGVAPQALALYEDLTAEENLLFFGRLFGVPATALRARADEVLDHVGLLPRKRDRVKGFSGGMQRRLNLAVAFVHDPPLLLLDEPTAGVDPHSRNNILDLVRHLASKGKTIVYTTHYMEEAARLCDRVGIIDKGKLLALETVPRLIAQHGGKSVVTVIRNGVEERTESDEPLHVISSAMTGVHADTVQGLRIDRPDLESVFLSLTGRSLRD